jgi:hypothetical protein
MRRKYCLIGKNYPPPRRLLLVLGSRSSGPLKREILVVQYDDLGICDEAEGDAIRFYTTHYTLRKRRFVRMS